jgi:hypothetical protein
MQFGSRADRILADEIPIKLDGIVYDAGEPAHDDVDIRDADSLCLNGMLLGDA